MVLNNMVTTLFDAMYGAVDINRWLVAGFLATKTFCTFAMLLPAQSTCPDSTAAGEVPVA